MRGTRPKGSRSIVVGGREFRWTLRRKPTYAQALGQTDVIVSVRLAGGAGSRLVILFSTPHPGNVLGLPYAAVTPGDVAAGIAAALRAGWEPEAAGAPFVVERARRSGS